VLLAAIGASFQSLRVEMRAHREEMQNLRTHGEDMRTRIDAQGEQLRERTDAQDKELGEQIDQLRERMRSWRACARRSPASGRRWPGGRG